jgi:hypothetical protein
MTEHTPLEIEYGTTEAMIARFEREAKSITSAVLVFGPSTFTYDWGPVRTRDRYGMVLHFSDQRAVFLSKGHTVALLNDGFLHRHHIRIEGMG